MRREYAESCLRSVLKRKFRRSGKEYYKADEKLKSWKTVYDMIIDFLERCSDFSDSYELEKAIDERICRVDEQEVYPGELQSSDGYYYSEFKKFINGENLTRKD